MPAQFIITGNSNAVRFFPHDSDRDIANKIKLGIKERVGGLDNGFQVYDLVLDVSEFQKLPARLSSGDLTGAGLSVLEIAGQLSAIAGTAVKAFTIGANSGQIVRVWEASASMNNRFLAANSSRIWCPINGPGPLGEELAKCFRSATYSERILDRPMILHRYFGARAEPISNWWFEGFNRGPLQAQLDGAILTEWGNTMDNVSIVRVPAGTKIYEGFAAPQAGLKKPFEILYGGGKQIYIDSVDPSWRLK